MDMKDMKDNNDASDWFDSLAGYPWEIPDLNEMWFCRRHFAPSPLLGAKGVYALLNLQSWALARLLPAGIKPGRRRHELKRWAYMKPICCHAGDEVMYQIWALCAPAEKNAEVQQ
jgi:hypothetical protein